MLEGEKIIYRRNDNYKKAYRGRELIWETSSANYLAFTSLGPATMSLENNSQSKYEIEFSMDRKNWSIYTFGDVLSLDKDQFIYFRGNNDMRGGLQFDINDGDIYASGNIMSIVKKDGFDLLKSVNGHAFNSLFMGCESLISAPDLPATTIADSCYLHMFHGCTKLSKGPEILPAMELAHACYEYMFENCSSLTKAPILPATELKYNCYMRMFYNCKNLNYIKANFIDNTVYAALSYWVRNVSPTGTFVKNPDAIWEDTFGPSAIPDGWTIERF